MCGEGASIIDGNEQNVVNLDIQHLMICVCHNNNTCSKEMFVDTNVQDAKMTGGHVDVVRSIMATEVDEGFRDYSQFGKAEEPEPEELDIPPMPTEE